MDKTNIKFINEIDVDITTEDDNEPQIMTLSVYECEACHWRFVGDCNRYGHGYTSEGVQSPNYCPMCGERIKESAEENKKIVWNDDMDVASGLEKDFENMDEFIFKVKRSFKEYTGESCQTENLVLQACVATGKGIEAETITPLVETDIIIQNWYTCEVSSN
ncbi:hypothetical protein [Wukongibacter sp. M2B1]|uniref:hypothetical protein n=1 Tax=Wukongibacter sp. M2B1 TaxID=3088895 RepID=UPI003D78C045